MPSNTKPSDQPSAVSRLRSLRGIWFFPAALLWLEYTLRFSTIGMDLPRGLLYTLGFSLAAGLLLYAILRMLPPRAGRITGLALLSVCTVFFMGQVVYYTVFQVYFTLFSVGGAGQVAQFAGVILSTVIKRWWSLLLMAVPLVIMCLWGSRIFPKSRLPLRRCLIPVAACLILQAVTTGFVLTDTGGAVSVSRLYTTEFISNLSVGRFGMLTTFRIEARNALIGPLPSVVPETPPEDVPEPEPEPEDPQYQPQVMDFDFAALAESCTDSTLKGMYEYFGAVSPTYENEYTGLFKGKNLIFLTCESLWKYAIDPQLTPTLYKLWREGFQFTNFYNPVWGVSTLDGEYVNLLGLIPTTGTWSMTETSDHWLPFSLGNQFRAEGVYTRAWHDHTYSYYSRDLSHPNLGYDYKGVGNGLKIKVTWPESDLEMMQATIGDYINDERFMVYYLTVSGHMAYNFYGNVMCMKNEELVADLDLPEPARAYLACNIELDRALEYLLQELEAAGRLEDTVLVLCPDHHPYGLEMEDGGVSINALAGADIAGTHEIYRSCFLLWSGSMESPIVIDKPVCSMDILPTISNLFDLQYDSRLMMGTDALSKSGGLVIFNDHSWLTTYGFYDAARDKFHPVEAVEMMDNDYYVTRINNLVDQKFNYSRLILRQDFYRKLWQDAGLTIGE